MEDFQDFQKQKMITPSQNQGKKQYKDILISRQK